MNKIKCIFLDRDGVINDEIGNYICKFEDFKITDGIIDILKQYRSSYKLIVITNQGGIAKGLYSHADVKQCHDYFQQQSDNLIDAWYYSPYHPVVTASLGRKPGSLLFEKAIAKFNIDPKASWMIGDKERDILPAKKLGMKTIRIIDKFAVEDEERKGDFNIKNLKDILNIIPKP